MIEKQSFRVSSLPVTTNFIIPRQKHDIANYIGVKCKKRIRKKKVKVKLYTKSTVYKKKKITKIELHISRVTFVLVPKASIQRSKNNRGNEYDNEYLQAKKKKEKKLSVTK